MSKPFPSWQPGPRTPPGGHSDLQPDERCLCRSAWPQEQSPRTMSQTRDPPSERLLAGRASPLRAGRSRLWGSRCPHPFPSKPQEKLEENQKSGAAWRSSQLPTRIQLAQLGGLALTCGRVRGILKSRRILGGGKRWGQEPQSGFRSLSRPPPPGLAELWDRATHKRRVVSVPATLPPPRAVLRTGTGRRASGSCLCAGPGAPGGWNLLDAAGASPVRFSCRTRSAAPRSSDKEAEATEKKWREKARLTWRPKAQPDSSSDSAGVCQRGPWRKERAQRGAGTPLSEHWKLPSPPGPRAALLAVTAPRDAGTLPAASSSRNSFTVGERHLLLNQLLAEPTYKPICVPQGPSSEQCQFLWQVE
uniref:uncharacterized protein LOC128928941 n=1 Tax=Callithrix jacchus TaxID=9483 RepID=UPI0023DD5F9A|nr:uncharacterized protein LOC128928941 [Callithrix jacchus]